jgi:hypothetical protein
MGLLRERIYILCSEASRINKNDAAITAGLRTMCTMTAEKRLAIAGALVTLTALKGLPTTSAQQQRAPALLQDYIAFTVTASPAALELDPFYKKYADAHGVPVVSSNKVPDAALLMALGGEPNGENTTSCAEENLLGYPGTRYVGRKRGQQ